MILIKKINQKKRITKSLIYFVEKTSKCRGIFKYYHGIKTYQIGLERLNEIFYAPIDTKEGDEAEILS